ncbi:hypothetical protein ONS96_010018 [Cadophora gregata f. sp. sojae]|nr:hypothetical protein ONS96_010018 [Cadophora gregata f. sp. sojae]
MGESRPKRTAAVKAESENKRLALDASKPMEAQDLQTREDDEREKTAPHRRASAQPDYVPKSTTRRHPFHTDGTVSQVQVLIRQASPGQAKTTPLPSSSTSQSVPAFSNFQQSSSELVTPALRRQARRVHSTGNSQRLLPPTFSNPGPKVQWPTPDAEIKRLPHVERQKESLTIPAQLPRLLDQVISSNRDIRQQASARAANAASFLSLAHPQPQNTIHHRFEKASPANRAFTKTVEGLVTPRTPPTDADAAQVLGRQMTTEDMRRLGLPNIEPEQRLQQAYYAHHMDVAQWAQGEQALQAQSSRTPHSFPRPQQHPPNQFPGPITYSSSSRQPTRLANVSTYVSSQKTGATSGFINPFGAGSGADPGVASDLSKIASGPRTKLHGRDDHFQEYKQGYSTEEREDSDATISPSPRKPLGPNRYSDATVSPSPPKNTDPVNNRVVPSVPLFQQEEAFFGTPYKAHLPQAGRIHTDRQVRAPIPLFDNEPIVRQRNLDFQHQSASYGVDPTQWYQQEEENSANFARELEYVNYQQEVGSRGDFIPLAGELQQNLTERLSHIDVVESRFQTRNYALVTTADLTTEEKEELRLSSTFATMLRTLRRATDKDKVQDEEKCSGQSSKPFFGCLAVTQLPPAAEVSLLSRSQSSHEIIAEDNDDLCVFCTFETCFGISDSRVWLPLEASPGYCNECHEDTQQVFRMWEGPYRLPHGLNEEARQKYKSLIEISTATPLKELGDTADFKSQQKVEMSKPQRQNAILNASNPGTKDSIRKQREQRKEYSLTNSARNVANVPRGGKLPQRRAVSGDLIRQNNFPPDAQRGVSNGNREHEQLGSSARNVTQISTPLSSHTATIPDLHTNQAVQTAWVNGAPSIVPLMEGKFAVGHRNVGARNDHVGVVTPNSASCKDVLDLSGPFGSISKSSSTTSKIGSPATAFPTSCNANISGYPNSTMSAQPTGEKSPSGIPLYFNAGPPECFLGPPSFSSAPIFCRGCPWRQVDFTKAKICTACRDCKFLICSHTHHLHFTLLTELAGVMNGDHEGHGLGRVSGSGRITADGRYGNCMVCPGQATHGCNDCPLRLCAECVVRLMKLCKGKMNELLNFYNNGRDHIRNDSFLLRNDNKGF